MRKTRYRKVTPQNSFINNFKEIAKEWHPTKNGKLLPTMVTYGSHKKVWWVCFWKHEWVSTVNDRTNSNHSHGCPYCSNKKVSKENNLAYKHPDLICEWHPTQNGKLTPYDVISGSKKKVWWICSKNHSYYSSINTKTSQNQGCPYCSGKRVSEENCLFVKSKKLSEEWDYLKNKKLTPKDVTSNSAKKVWWLCSKNHSYLAAINDRMTNHSGCPYCSGHKVSQNNCLRNKYPQLCQEWNYNKNGKLTPDNVSFGSNKKVWWVCRNGHEWISNILHRSDGRGCPYCHKIELKDGTVCDSLPEAIKYMEFKKMGFKFRHDGVYHKKLGKCRYDFYFLDDNKYVEVTSYNKHYLSSQPGRYFKYLRKIVKKRRFVERILKAKFEFIQFIPTPKQIKMVRENIK